MPRKCFVTTCTNTYRKTKNVCVIDEKTCTLTTITYHSFPKDADLRRKWIKATGRINWEPSTTNTYICSEHFRESDYIIEPKPGEFPDAPTQLKRVLKKNAVPSQLLGSIMVAGDSEVYLKEDHYASSTGELSDQSHSSEDRNQNPVSFYPQPLFTIKTEPELENYHFENSSTLTSTFTVKEENDISDRCNGVFEPEILLDESKSHIFEQSNKYQPDMETPIAKRIKHSDNFISSITVKTERPSTPDENSISIEEKYEQLLDQFYY
ncbi:hypothetical protein HHI36_005321 [Cryptolaemus montrouzieri]|uniref:THAP-type domain-containing protein n=1 Tax=Cryptolaemus montrouzieri TaxID=559131 RepID=A0ABD2NU12_9CUCU